MKTTTNPAKLTLRQIYNCLALIDDVESGRTNARSAERLAADAVARIEAEGYVVADLFQGLSPTWH